MFGVDVVDEIFAGFLFEKNPLFSNHGRLSGNYYHNTNTNNICQRGVKEVWKMFLSILLVTRQYIGT